MLPAFGLACFDLSSPVPDHALLDFPLPARSESKRIESESMKKREGPEAPDQLACGKSPFHNQSSSKAGLENRFRGSRKVG